ncbi:restriction endonuclease S subunits [Candidatus Scalindua japonica]|uniref:Restriction endonuclease S subunits n=1 Tax=Candidatus Scalindua japonica TaxID=1284222 RepID=A0A286U0F9_9BACT|nr:restriction endonuclease S subunits [Candidatus Scalindua japonica]
MVRLSLVNLYLHGFSDPHIHEYDTLSSEERWNDSYDVILANPPFMSPKGGIRPHKKFTISSNRSEVLFVDYIAEHLNPKGKAGIIVPEGVIFQSGTAYRDLRKMLVENYLYAVVSLPAGVFNPYSGVKTSILLMGKEVAKLRNEILFVKIDNDGYNLGAQRTVVKGSQLDEAIELTREFVRTGDSKDSLIAHAVVKTEITKNGDYNLSGERYRIHHVENTVFPIINLGEIVDVKGGKRLPKGATYSDVKTDYPYIRVADFDDVKLNKSDIKYLTQEVQSQISNYTIDKEDVYISIAGTIGLVGVIPEELDNANLTENAAKLIIKNKSKVNNRFLSLILRTDNSKNQIISLTHAVGVPKLALSRIKQIKIPLLPLSIQEEIVAEIEGYQKIIDGAKAVVNNYKPKIDINPDWEMVELGKTCEINPKKSVLKDLDEELEVSFVPMADLNENQIGFIANQTKPLGEVIKGYTYFKNDDVLLAKVTPCFENGKAGIARDLVNGIGFGSSEYYVVRPNEKILSTWIYLNIITDNFRERGKLNMTGTGGLQRVPTDFIKTTLVPLPPLEIQHQIVEEIEKELALVNANKQLIDIFEQKIKDRIAKVWGE